MVEKILQWNKKEDSIILKTVSKKVELFNEALHSVAADLIDTNKAADGYGLSAIQIGVTLRVMVLDFKEPIVYVNPEIIKAESRIKYDERCLSFPGFKARTKRKSRITIKYQNLVGEEKEYSTTNPIEAICIQHEIDHMNGILLNDVGHLAKG